MWGGAPWRFQRKAGRFICGAMHNIRVIRTISKDGGVAHWATNDLTMRVQQRGSLTRQTWGIGVNHRGIKQFCGVGKSQARKAETQRNHVLIAFQASLRLEARRLRTGISWYQSKADMIRSALREYLAHPLYFLNPTA